MMSSLIFCTLRQCKKPTDLLSEPRGDCSTRVSIVCGWLYSQQKELTSLCSAISGRLPPFSIFLSLESHAEAAPSFAVFEGRVSRMLLSWCFNIHGLPLTPCCRAGARLDG